AECRQTLSRRQQHASPGRQIDAKRLASGTIHQHSITETSMLGLMQQQPLLISSLIDFAARHHGDAEIVSRRVEGDLHRYTWRDVATRAKQAANALDSMNLLF